jgi:hypothetical protein
MAGDSGIPGLIYRRLDDKHEPVGFSDITIAELLDVPLSELQAGLKRLVETEKITINERGVITIINWKKYQSEYRRQEVYRKDNQSYKRVCNQGYNKNSNLSNATERDIDIEREEERDIEKESERGIKQNQKGHKTNTEDEKILGDIIVKWNNFANRYGLAKVEFIKPGTTRYQKLRARLKEKEFDFDAILREIEQSDFLKGASSNWRVTFDWLICPSNYPKILEGNYRDQKTFQVGEHREKDDHPPGYWEKTLELKEKGLAGEALMTELKKVFPEYFRGWHSDKSHPRKINGTEV